MPALQDRLDNGWGEVGESQDATDVRAFDVVSGG